jgi:hypothetical protein
MLAPLAPQPYLMGVEKLTQGTGHVFCRSESHTVVYGHWPNLFPQFSHLSLR